MFVSMRCASRTSRTPLAVIWKYRFARPPRSGVGSPIVDVTKPLRSSRSSAAYTLPSATSRPVRSSISCEIGTPYALSPTRINESSTISSRLPRYSLAIGNDGGIIADSAATVYSDGMSVRNLSFVLFAALFLAAPSVSAQQARRAQSDQEILIKLERDWDFAFHHKDVKFIETVLATEFVATYAEGQRADRAKELQNAEEFNQQIDSSVLDEFIVHVY